MEKGFTKQMAQDLAMIADCLKQVFAGHVRYAGLQEAMEYSLMAGRSSPWRPAACAAEPRRLHCPLPVP